MASRTKNVSRNLVAGFVGQFVSLLFPFLIRAIIIRVLGSDFLGLDSLFTSILQVLNLAELGFSSAVVYSMYEPVAKKDKKTICALLNLYRKIYRIIGLIILSSGLLLLPFIPLLINGGYPQSINVYVLYLIYLVNTSISYLLFAYKGALLSAHQRSDIISNFQTITKILRYSLQIFILFTLKNYYLFAIIEILSTVINNICIAVITKKYYPEYICAGDIDKKGKTKIKKRVFGLMVQRICATTRNSLDSIFISAMFGLNIVAIYGNYYNIMSAVISIMSVISTAILASVGNSIVTETEGKNYHDMNRFNFIYMWLSGWMTICLACLYQPFMELWMGSENMFPYSVIILFCIYFYSLKMGDIRATYSDAKGLWYENRFRAIIESFANIILNFILGKLLGIHGIIMGTLISLLVINFGYGSQILFKYYFKHQKASEYFIRHGIYALVTFIICLVTYFICSFIGFDGIMGLGIKAFICLILPNLLYVLVYHRTGTFMEAMALASKVVKLNNR